MAKFCAKCGAPLKDHVKFCSKCGAPVPVDTVVIPVKKEKPVAQQTNVSMAKSVVEEKMQTSNQTVKYLACAVAAVAVIGGGLWGYDTYKSKNVTPVETNVAASSASAEKTEALENTDTEDGSMGQLTDESRDKLDKAREEMQKMGASGERLTATSYGHSDKGFMAMVAGSAMVFDTQNHRYATIANYDCLKKLTDLGYSKHMYPVLVQFIVWNDTHDQDANAGYWEGNRHVIPINMNFKYENGKLVDNGLFTANGRGASNYQTYLYEQKNVDLAHIFMEETIPLLEDMHQRDR